MPEELPRGWVKTILGEVCVMNPRTRLESLPPDHTAVSFVPMAAVEEESGRLDASQIRPLRDVRRGYTPFKENDVIFAKITPCMENGKIALATGLKNGLAYGSTEFIVFRCYQGLLPRFLLYFLLQPSLRQAAEHQMSGAVGQKRVPSNYLFNYEVLLPPTHEQERIVAKLDAALSGLERAEIVTHRAQERLKRYRSAVLNAAVTGELTRKWREARLKNRKAKAEPGETLLQRLIAARQDRWEDAELKRLRANGKEPEDDKWKSRYPEPHPPRTEGLPNLTEGWIWASLDQIGELNRGKSRHRPRDDVRLYGGPYPFIQTGDIRKSGGTIHEHTQTYSEFGLEQSRIWPAGTLCITIAANIAETGILSYPACFPDSVVGFVQNDTLLKVRFVEFFIRSQKSELKRSAPATAQKNINLEILKGLAIPLPPIAEQTEIVHEAERRLLAADKLSAVIEQKLARTVVTRQSLLHNAFAGQLVSQNPNDEPASVLIKRIHLAKEEEKKKPKGGPMPKSTSKITRRALLAVLREHKGEITPEQLFQEAGFEAEQVDLFYRELATLRKKIRERKPEASISKLWPHRANVLLQLKAGAEK